MIEQLNQLALLYPLAQLQQLAQLGELHFLRPLWLLSALPALALTFYLWRRQSSGANWRRAIAANLLAHLLEPQHEQRQRWPWLALIGWLIAALAMAGPTWEKFPQPVLQKRDALVIVLDLSLSMYAEDVKPSRLQRARFKILDILNRRHEGVTGLVAYSGDAHVVSPLTDDTATIANLVPALAPDMMPNYGSDPVSGIEQAIQLLHNAGFERGRILLLSDEITDANIAAIAERIGGGHWQLSIIGVGTEQGAPIPINSDGKNDGFLKQRDGNIVVAQLHRERFEQLARQSHGRYSDLRVDDQDIDALLPIDLQTNNEARTVQREFDQWRERGAWLAMLLLPLAALAFRRGWLLMLLILPLSTPSEALEWSDLWQRHDQQAQQAIDAGDAKTAAEKFRDPAWRGAAQYRAGDYATAAQTLKNIDTPDADYNRGNALARAGQLPEAIAAYDAALQKNPNLADAKANRELVEELLQQQKQQQGDSTNKDNKNKSDKNQDADNQQAGQKSQQQGGDKNQQSGNSEQKDAQPSDSQNNDSQNAKAQDGKSDNSTKQAKSQDDAAQQQNADKNQQAAQAQQNANAKEAADKKQQAVAGTDQPSKEEQQQRATEQWLRQIPDDPAGLLRRKFLYEHRQQERSAAPRDNQQPLW